MNVLDNYPWASIIGVLVTLVGGVLCILGTLTFPEYVENLGIALGGLGVWGVARSLAGKGGSLDH